MNRHSFVFRTLFSAALGIAVRPAFLGLFAKSTDFSCYYRDR